MGHGVRNTGSLKPLTWAISIGHLVSRSIELFAPAATPGMIIYQAEDHAVADALHTPHHRLKVFLVTSAPKCPDLGRAKYGGQEYAC
jgi:hypothetical protein